MKILTKHQILSSLHLTTAILSSFLYLFIIGFTTPSLFSLSALIISAIIMIYSFKLFSLEQIKIYLFKNNIGEYLKLKSNTKTLKQELKYKI